MSALFQFNDRIGTTVNLPTGATYDLLLISFPDGFPQSQLKFEIADTPRKVTGLQKVAQMFMKILFTYKGSNPIYPNQGTYFSSYVVNANRVDDDATLTAELIQQINDAQQQCQYILNTTGADTASQLQKTELLGLDVTKDQLVIYIRILTKAGAMASVAVPFPQLDLPLSDQMVK
ncbi:hypothetical protein D3C87_460070 [compost metagenome]